MGRPIEAATAAVVSMLAAAQWGKAAGLESRNCQKHVFVCFNSMLVKHLQGGMLLYNNVCALMCMARSVTRAA